MPLSTTSDSAGPTRADATRWVFTGALQDRQRLDGKCAACGKPAIRITFEVRRLTEAATCHICQDCLGQRPIFVEHEGRALEGQERRDYLSALSVRLKHRTCRQVLRNLLARTDDAALREVAVYFDRNLQLSPGHAATLFLALSRAQLDADPAIFDMQIRSVAHRREFGGLNEREKSVLWPILSPALRKRLTSLGFAPQSHAAPRPTKARPQGAGPQLLAQALFSPA